MTPTEELLRRALETQAASVTTRPAAAREFADRLARTQRLRPARRLTLVVAAAGTALATVVIVLVAAVIANHPASNTSRPQRTLTASDVLARVPLDVDARRVVTGLGSVWVVTGDGRLVRVDPIARRVMSAVRVTPDLSDDSIVFGDGAVWVGDVAGRSILMLDPRTGRIVHRTPVTSAGPVSVGLSGVWAQTAPEAISQLDPATGKVRTTLSLTHAPQELLDANGALWVATSSAVIVRVDPSTGRMRNVQLAAPALSLAATAHSLWASTTSGLVRLSLNGQVRNQLLLHVTGGLAADHVGSILYASTADGTLAVVPDAAVSSPALVHVDSGFVGPAVGFGSVWLVDRGELLRVRSLTH